jgi:hypothetical protein
VMFPISQTQPVMKEHIVRLRPSGSNWNDQLHHCQQGVILTGLQYSY